MLTRKPNEIVGLIRQSQRIALCCHINPDGDTLGSALALRLGLMALSKRVDVFCQQGAPHLLRMLPGAETLRLPETAQGAYDLLIAIDISDTKRMGTCAALMEHAAHTAQIDHHGTNTCFMQVNSVDPAAPATALLIRQQLSALEVAITPEIAQCLYVGISTDTGNFSYSSTSAETFCVMAELMEAGLPLGEINRQLYCQREKPQVQLLQRALASMAFYEDDRITMMTLMQRDFAACGATAEHTDPITNYGLDIEGVKLSAFLRETLEGSVKVSLRSVAPARVDQVAASFGGGGHPQAAGATVDMPINEAREKVLAALRRVLNEDNE